MIRAAIAWLLVVFLAAVVLFMRLHRGVALQTDLAALLMPTGGATAVRRAQDLAAASLAQRVFVLIGDHDRASARNAGAALADACDRSGLATTVTYRLPPNSLIALARMYFPYRFGLLTNEDRELLRHAQGDHIVARALATVYGPEAIADAAMLRRDPFLLLPTFLTALPLPLSNLALDDGILTVHDGNLTWVLLAVQLKGNVYALTVQDRFVAIFDATVAALRRQTPGLAIARVGAIFYAHQGAHSAVSETTVITVLSIIGTILLILIVFRDPRPLALTLLAIGVGVLCAFSVCLSIYGGIHVVVLLLGASLTGIAIDYCLQYITARFGPDAGTPRERLQRVLPGITLGALTTLIGYLTLMLAPFPGLRQLAVFSAVGLAASFLTVVLWLPLLDSPLPLSDRAGALKAAGLLWDFWQLPNYRRGRLLFVVLCVTAAGIGLSRFTIDDDLRHQQVLSGTLRDEETRVRHLTGMTGGTEFFILQDGDSESAAQREELLLDRLATAKQGGFVSGYQAITPFIPSIKRQRENRELVNAKLLQPHLHDYYQQLGVTDGMQPVVPENSFLTPAALSPDSPLAFLRNLTLTDDMHGTTRVVLLNRVSNSDAMRTIAATVPGVHYADPVGELSASLAAYRRRAIILLAVSALLMMPVLIWRYGWRGSLRTALPPITAVILAPLLAGVSFNFFGAIALILVLSIGFDYTVFCRESAPSRRAVTMLGVCLAMVATLLSFGLLGFSRTYAVHAFGTTLLIGTILAFILAPLAGRPNNQP